MSFLTAVDDFRVCCSGSQWLWHVGPYDISHMHSYKSSGEVAEERVVYDRFRPFSEEGTGKKEMCI